MPKIEQIASEAHNNINQKLWSEKAKNLSPYVPGEQPNHSNLCKLNTNENPFSPSPMVIEAIQLELSNQAHNLRLYPTPESDALREQLANTYKLDSKQVFVGNGSDEVLALVFACFFMKPLPLLAPDISYSFYPVYSETFNVDLITIPLSDDFSINIDDYSSECGGIIIANPNAPTGLLLSLTDIETLCNRKSDAVIVIDEAYIDFSDSGWQGSSAINLINKYDNLIVTQTFSKSRSLAGLRVGMAFANPSLIEALTRMKNSFNSYPIDRLAQAGAKASLEDEYYFNHNCQQVIDLRKQLTKELTKLGFNSLKSQANFIFTKPPSTIWEGNAEKLAQELRDQGIIVRYFNKDRINQYLRITIGTEEQNLRLVTALQALEVIDLPDNSDELATSNTENNDRKLPTNLTTNDTESDDEQDNSIRFFLKCYNNANKKTQTYRFNSQKELTKFAKLSSARGYTILDTHITFYDIDLVFSDLSEADDSIINATDISLAENGIYWINEWQH